MEEQRRAVDADELYAYAKQQRGEEGAVREA